MFHVDTRVFCVSNCVISDSTATLVGVDTSGICLLRHTSNLVSADVEIVGLIDEEEVFVSTVNFVVCNVNIFCVTWIYSNRRTTTGGVEHVVINLYTLNFIRVVQPNVCNFSTIVEGISIDGEVIRSDFT